MTLLTAFRQPHVTDVTLKQAILVVKGSHQIFNVSQGGEFRLREVKGDRFWGIAGKGSLLDW